VTCLAGDIIGDYSFDKPLKSGDMIIFTDMAHYTMVKNNMFNGINLPAIYLMKDKNIELIRKFSYKDYKSRL
jgi:carboxynorspermidine decarboxylase